MLLPPSVKTARLTPGLEPFISLYFFIACADSSVSLTQRPELAAISAPACVAAPPVLRTLPSRGRSRSFDGKPSDERKRSTADGSPMTAMPSPSLIS